MATRSTIPLISPQSVRLLATSSADARCLILRLVKPFNKFNLTSNALSYTSTRAEESAGVPGGGRRGDVDRIRYFFTAFRSIPPSLRFGSLELLPAQPGDPYRRITDENLSLHFRISERTA